LLLHYRQWTFPVKAYLKAGQDNTLTITIKSAFKTSLANKEAYPYHIPTLYVSPCILLTSSCPSAIRACRSQMQQQQAVV
jgi:hypothetical protein